MRSILRPLALAALLSTAGIAGAADAPANTPLKVCVDQDDPPFAAEATPERGIDVEVAQALAQQLGRPLRLVWVQVPNRGGLGKALRQTLVAGQCDAYLGIPQGPEMAGDLAERKLTQSGPYLLLGYVAVAAPGRPAPTVAGLRRARKIGAVTATPADLYLHRMNLPRSPFASSAALLAGLKSGEIDAALIWSPWLADDAAKDFVRGSEPLGDADLVAGLTVATRRADEALTRDIAAAVETLRGAGRFDAIAQRHDLPKITPP